MIILFGKPYFPPGHSSTTKSEMEVLNKNKSVMGHSSYNWQQTGAWFNIKMLSYQHWKSHCGDKTILRPSYLHNGISYTGKMTSLYWIWAQVIYHQPPPQVHLHNPHRKMSTGKGGIMHANHSTVQPCQKNFLWPISIERQVQIEKKGEKKKVARRYFIKWKGFFC